MSPIRIILALLAIGFGIVPSSAQTYPTKPIRLVVPTSPGGITDTLARALAQRLTDSFGQQVIVENRSSGAGQLSDMNGGRAAYRVSKAGLNDVPGVGPNRYGWVGGAPIRRDGRGHRGLAGHAAGRWPDRRPGRSRPGQRSCR